MTVLVTGSSGFIGSHLVKYLQNRGDFVVGVDIEWHKYSKPDAFYLGDLREQSCVHKIFENFKGFDEVYNLGCLMGGMGYIGQTEHSYDIMVGSTEIVSNVLDASIKYGVGKSFYSSSACVYNMNLQEQTDNVSLSESDAYPAMPDLMYGWQKLQSELMYQAAKEQHGLNIRIARFHNIFGEEGTWHGGKEKYPAAICRKVSQAKDGDTIVIWGDGKQTRSFLHIDECICGIMKLMNSNVTEPLNIGSDENISIDDVAKMVIEISGKSLSIQHDLTKPQGVRGRNSNNNLIAKKLGWQPIQPLNVGIEKLYNWINKQVNG